MSETDTEAAQQQAELEALEYTASDAAWEQVGAGQQPATQEPSTQEVLQPLLEMGFGILAPNWNVASSEVEQLSSVYADLVDKYFPDGVGDYGLEINAILITGAVVLPRMRLPRKVEEQPKQHEGGESGAEAE